MQITPNTTLQEVDNALCKMVGKKVSGNYHGVAFSGNAVSTRGVTVRPYTIELTIELDAPITVYGQNRDSVIISGQDIIRNQNTNVELA